MPLSAGIKDGRQHCQEAEGGRRRLQASVRGGPSPELRVQSLASECPLQRALVGSSCTGGHEEEQPPSLAIRTENESSKPPLCKASDLRPRLAQPCTITPSKLQLHSREAGRALQKQSCEPRGFREFRTPSSTGWKKPPTSLRFQARASGEWVVMECVPFRDTPSGPRRDRETEICSQWLWSHTLTSIPQSLCKGPSPRCPWASEPGHTRGSSSSPAKTLLWLRHSGVHFKP